MYLPFISNITSACLFNGSIVHHTIFNVPYKKSEIYVIKHHAINIFKSNCLVIARFAVQTIRNGSFKSNRKRRQDREAEVNIRGIENVGKEQEFLLRQDLSNESSYKSPRENIYATQDSLSKNLSIAGYRVVNWNRFKWIASRKRGSVHTSCYVPKMQRIEKSYRKDAGRLDSILV